MDDLQFRRSLYADPQYKDAAINEAIKTDPTKQKFAQEIEQLDDKIAQALKVPVPDDLCNKLILRQTLASHQQQKRKKRVHLALAASVAFAFGLTINWLQFSNAYTTMSDYAIAHVEHEADYFSNDSDARVTLASLNQKMTSFNGSFTENMGEILFADFCRFDGMKSLHIVLQGKNSPITVFVIPKNDHLKFNQEFSGNDLNGLSTQFKDANIIVVGDKSESLKQWQYTIDNNVQWST